MKVIIINAAGNSQHLTVVARDVTTGADGASYSIAPGETFDLDVSDRVQPVLTPGALIDGGVAEPSLFPDASVTTPVDTTAPVGTTENPAPIGSAEEVATRTDAAGNPAPVPSFSPGPAPADVAALEAAGIDPAHADPMSSVLVDSGELAPAPATPEVVIATPAGDEVRPATDESGPPTVAGTGEPLEGGPGGNVEGDGLSGTLTTGPDGGQVSAEEATALTSATDAAAAAASGESTITEPETAGDTPPAGAGEDSLPGAETSSANDTNSSADNPSGSAGDDTLTEATDEQIQDAIRQVARDSGMAEEILKMMDVRLVNALLRDRGFLPITAEKRNEMQTAMPDSVNAPGAG